MHLRAQITKYEHEHDVKSKPLVVYIPHPAMAHTSLADTTPFPSCIGTYNFAGSYPVLPTLPSALVGRHHLEAYRFDSTDTGLLGMYLGVLRKAPPWV